MIIWYIINLREGLLYKNWADIKIELDFTA